MDTIAQDALLKYDIGRIQSTDYQREGYSNRSYRVETKSGVFLFREFLQQSRRQVLQEFALLSAVENHGCPVPRPISSLAGENLIAANGRLFALFPFIAGAEPPLCNETARQVGRAAGHLSLINGVEGFDALLGASWMNAMEFMKSPAARALSEDEQLFIREESAYFQRALPTDLPRGVIHGDLFPDNVLFEKDELVAILDFEEAADDTLVLDVGIAINGFCFINQELDRALMEAFLEGYESCRKLLEPERRHLSTYIRYGLFGILFWHISHRATPSDLRQKRRINELRLRYHSL